MAGGGGLFQPEPGRRVSTAHLMEGRFSVDRKSVATRRRHTSLGKVRAGDILGDMQ